MFERYEIWKLQRPLFASDGQYNMVMAYTEDKTDTAMIPMAAEDINTLFGDEAKIYVKAKVRNGNLVVDNVVEEQAW